MNRPGRAGRPALAAADALDAVRLFPDGDVHPARLPAAAAVDAGALLYPVTVEGNRVKQPIDGAQRAEVLAEGAVELDRQDDHRQQHQHLPVKQQPRRRAQRRVCRQQRDAAEQRSARAEVLAEPRVAHPGDAGDGHRQEDDKQPQHHKFEPPQHPVSGQIFLFLKQRNFVQQVLHQPKGAQPPADKPPQHRAKQHQKAQHIAGKAELAAVQHRLQRTDRAGAQRPRAGVAVKARHAEEL